MVKRLITRSLKDKVGPDLSHHVGMLTAFEGSRTLPDSQNLQLRGAHLRQNLQLSLDHGLLAGYQKDRRSQLNSIPRINSSRANLQDMEEEQFYKERNESMKSQIHVLEFWI